MSIDRVALLGLVACASASPLPMAPPRFPALAAGEAKFTGKITAIEWTCPSDGYCVVSVDGKRVLVECCNLLAGKPPVKGMSYDLGPYVGDDPSRAIGLEVEVFAKITDDGVANFEIQGKREYYIQLVHPAWPLPAGYTRVQIPAERRSYHQEMRLAPGFFDARSPNRWSYAFAWPTLDRDDDALRADLIEHFKRRWNLDVTVAIVRAGNEYTLHVQGDRLDLAGIAHRRSCATRAATPTEPVEIEGDVDPSPPDPEHVVFGFALHPADAPAAAELERLARDAPCPPRV